MGVYFSVKNRWLSALSCILVKKKTLRIAVNTRLLLKNKLDGIGWFTYETLKRITNNHPEHDFFFLFDRPFDEEFVFADNVTPMEVGWLPARHPLLYYLWYEHAIPSALSKINADLFFSPDGFLSLNTPVPSVTVIHDINFHHRPKDLPFVTRNYYNYYFPRFAKKACRLMTVSEYSKCDISQTYNINPDIIDVVYNGASDQFKPLPMYEKVLVKQQFTNGADYFVFVGSLHPRKNVVSLLQAFDLFKTRTGSDFKLVIVGNKMFQTSDIERTFENMRFKDDVLFTGRLSQEDLPRVLGAAFALTFVPFFEGFGIPIIEAMNCDVPVISSKITSMPEVAGDAAIYVDPFSIESICKGMISVFHDAHLRQHIIEKARIQRANFSWENTAQGVWNSLNHCLINEIG